MKTIPCQSGNKGYACHPLAANLPPEDVVKRMHPDWKRIPCPSCGQDCWESSLAREMKAKGITGLCTLCSLKKTLGV